VGIHTVSLAAQGLSGDLPKQDIGEDENDRVGGRNREGGTSRGQRDHDAGGKDKEEGSEHKEFGVHFYT